LDVVGSLEFSSLFAAQSYDLSGAESAQTDRIYYDVFDDAEAENDNADDHTAENKDRDHQPEGACFLSSILSSSR
jgi:hypothetical protein